MDGHDAGTLMGLDVAVGDTPLRIVGQGVGAQELQDSLADAEAGDFTMEG